MKINKINKEFLDLYYKKKLIACEIDDYYGKVYLTDSYRLFILNIEDLALKLQLFRTCNLKKLLDDTGYEDGIITNGLVETETSKEKFTIRIIKNDNITVNVNDKYLKLFDNPKVKIKDDHSPVLIYENDELVGLILPIKEY